MVCAGYCHKSGIDKLDDMVNDFFVNRGDMEETNASKLLCLMFLCLWFVLCLCTYWLCGFDLGKGLVVCEKRFEMCILL